MNEKPFRPQDHVSEGLKNFLEDNLGKITDHVFSKRAEQYMKEELQKMLKGAGVSGEVISVNVPKLEAEILFKDVMPEYRIRGKFKFEAK